MRSTHHRVVSNSAYGVLDYLVQPALMLLSARYFLRHLGAPQFGLWMLVLAIVGGSATLSTGFGDAAVKYVSRMRGRMDWAGLEQMVQASFTINLLLGSIVAVILWIIAPHSQHIFRIDTQLSNAWVWSLRIGALLLVIRSVEFVFISTLRAFEHYQPAVLISALARIATITVAVLLVRNGAAVTAIIAATTVVAIVSLGMQIWMVRLYVGALSLAPAINFRSWRPILTFGTFSWMQALSGTIFSQADRLLVSAMLGTTALAYYSLCVQIAQPIHGLIASGMNVLFPHLSTKAATHPAWMLRPNIARSILINLAAASAMTLPLVFGGKYILRLWMGRAMEEAAAPTLRLVALSFGFLACNVAGHYALLALGRVRYLTTLNLIGAGLALSVAAFAIPRFGMSGAAIGRLTYGPVTWIMYWNLHRLLAKPLEPAVDTGSVLATAGD
jgi:O-antigen/teichoic acid export membrane protein